MAITPEDIQRIQAAVEAGNHTQDADIQALAGLGLVIRSQAEETTFEQNLRHRIRGEEEVPAYENIERTITELTGAKKNEGEKTSEFMKRTMGEVQAQLAERQAEIDRLKQDKPDDQRVLTLQAELAKKEKEYQKQLKDANRQLVDYKLDREFDIFRAQIEADAQDIEEKLRPDVVENRLRKMRDKVEVRFDAEGNTQYWDRETGQQILNPTTLENPKHAEIAARFTADLKTAPAGQGGTGGKPGGEGGKPGGAGAYAGAAHKGQLMELLSKDGLTSDSEEFATAFEAATKAYEQHHGKPMPLFGE